MAEVSASNIKKTQEALTKYVKKPPLTEKLLKKPPFRYLHDIITAIIKETGFLNGLFTNEELDSSNIKDKEAKIMFLNKLIAAIRKIANRDISVRSVKIIAGLEVNNTLELLQLIGKALDDKIDTTQIVSEILQEENDKLQKVNKSNHNKEKKVEKPLINNVVTDKVEENKLSNGTETSNILSDTEINNTVSGKDTKQKDIEANTNELDVKEEYSTSKNQNSSVKIAEKGKSASKSKISRKEIFHDKISSKNNKINSLKTPVVNEDKRNNNVKRNTNLTGKTKDFKTDSLKKKEETTLKNKKPGSENSKHSVNKSSGDSKNNKIDQIQTEKIITDDYKTENSIQNNEKNEEVSVIKKKEIITVQRPGSARPGSRKISIPADSESANETGSTINSSANLENNSEKMKNKNTTIFRPKTATRPPSARPGAPRIKDKGEISVTEEFESLSNNKVNVFEEGNQDFDEKENIIVIKSEDTPMHQETEITSENQIDQGHLVHQILTTQKEFNQSITNESSQNKYLELEFESGRKREKELITKEIGEIRDFIQNLTSAANPLGKLFDFLQQDVDEMQKELLYWKNINEKLQMQQKTEFEKNEVFLQPLKKQLGEIENNIQDEYLLITNIKTTILMNDDRILKFLNDNKKLS